MGGVDERCSALAVGCVCVSEMIPGALGGGDLRDMETNFGSSGPVKGSQPVRSLPVLLEAYLLPYLKQNTVLCVLSSAFGHLWKILTRLEQKSKNQVLHITEVFKVHDFSQVSCTLENSGLCTATLLLKPWLFKPFFPCGHLCSQ